MNPSKLLLSSLAGASLFSLSVTAQVTTEKLSTTSIETTPTTTTSAAASKDIGISARDGITLSGKDVMITRNGVTEQLTQPLELPNGIRVSPDGSAVLPDLGKITLRASQILTFDGKLIEPAANVPAPIITPATTTTTTTLTPQPVPATPVITPLPVPPAPVVTPATEAAAKAAADAEAERRAKAAASDSVESAK